MTPTARSIMRRLLVSGPRGAEDHINVALLRILYGPDSFGPGCKVGWGHHVLAPGQNNIHFGPDCIVGRHATIEVRTAEGRLTVGGHSLLSHDCTIAVGSSVEIGEDCLVGEMTSIRDHDHDFSSHARPVREQGSNVAPVAIGSNVWLGARVTVTKGVTIGDNAVVGAGAVVTHDIPGNSLAVGVPARVVRTL